MLAAINHVPTAQALACERAFLGGARRFLPHADRRTCDGRWRQAGVQRPDPVRPTASARMTSSSEGAAADAADIGRAAGEKVRRNAGVDFFDGWS